MATGSWLGVLGFVLTGLNSAKSAERTGEANAAIQRYNAQVSEMQAADAIERGREALDIHRVKTRRMIGAQRAAFAASGVDISDVDSTAQNVFADTLAMSEEDAIAIQTNAAREAWGFKTQARDYGLRGQIARAEGKDKALGTMLSTAGTALYTKYGFRSS